MGMGFRPINYLPIKANNLKESETVVPILPENVVLSESRSVVQSSARSFDFGRYCFSRKEYKTKFNIASGKKEFRVDLESILPARRAFVAGTINFIRETTSAETTIIDKASKINHFFFFIEKNIEEDEWPDTKDKALKCYGKYLEYLIGRSRLPRNSSNSILPNSAVAYGKLARRLIEFVYDLSEREIERKFPSLMSKRVKKNVDISSKLERQKFIHVCLSIFEQCHEAILDRKPFPWVINLSNAGFDKKFLWGGVMSVRSKLTPYLYQEDGSIVTFEELTKKLDSLGFGDVNSIVDIKGVGRKSRGGIISYYKSRIECWNEVNNNKNIYDGMLYTSWELSVRCFLFCFIAATGVNYSVASSLVYGSEEFIPQRGYVFSGLKVRSGNKIVYAEFNKVFEKYFLKFKELRSWAVSKLNVDPELWFFLFAEFDPHINRRGIQRLLGERKINRDSYIRIPSGPSSALNSIFKIHDIDVKYISSKDLRQGVAFDWHKISGGDVALVAQKLGNNISTVQQAYSSVNDEDAYPELSEYYGKVIERVKALGQSESGGTPVKILVDDKTENLPVGSCENPNLLKPKKALQFSRSAPNPDCARSETCLFCEYFAIHADKNGLKKLLSFREIFPLIKERSGSIDRYITIFAPIEGRIDEILKYIKESFPAKADLIEEVLIEVSEGELDEFWEHHFNFLVELGYVK